MNKIWNRKCEVCLKRGIERKARTLCDECREFLCKECSDTHLLYKWFINHNLIDLDPPGDEARSADKSELASDFLENLTVSETTVLYRAQVAVEGGARSSEGKKVTQKRETKAKQDNVEKINVKKVHEFSVSRSDDKEDIFVSGVLTLNDTIIIADYFNMKLKLFDLSGNFLSSTDMKYYTWGITHINNDKFATCGGGYKVFLWTVRGQTIVSEDESYDVDHDAYGIHYNGTYYCVLHSLDNAVTILDRQGRRVRKIVMKEAFGKEIKFRWDIHMDRDKHDIYVPCVISNSGVLCMSVEGEALWFTPLSNAKLWGVTEIHGVLCIADCKQQCLHLISKTGQCMKKLPEKEKMDGQPNYIYYEERNNKLYVSHRPSSGKKDIIFIYSIQ